MKVFLLKVKFCELVIFRRRLTQVFLLIPPVYKNSSSTFISFIYIHVSPSSSGLARSSRHPPGPKLTPEKCKSTLIMSDLALILLCQGRRITWGLALVSLLSQITAAAHSAAVSNTLLSQTAAETKTRWPNSYSRHLAWPARFIRGDRARRFLIKVDLHWPLNAPPPPPPPPQWTLTWWWRSFRFKDKI